MKRPDVVAITMWLAVAAIIVGTAWAWGADGKATVMMLGMIAVLCAGLTTADMSGDQVKIALAQAGMGADGQKQVRTEAEGSATNG